ncbi:hypothetical protein BDZ94DRAFT_797277 [Collybia nuda]|uniref:Uncharacterized protein n=1 Tax=Collybia nuda TaxID=64659 RepID=A0A9P5Y1Q8_9AGAR|nr:hypothetical protein BDZ94DRAFT_797277 [Collybia nuda]
MNHSKNQITPPLSTLGATSPTPPVAGTESVALDHQVDTAKAFAILSTLFAGVQAQLLSGIPDDTAPNFSQALMGTLQFFSYGGLAINISASLAAIFFISLANLERDSGSRVKSSPKDMVVVAEVLDQLRHLYLGLTLTCLKEYFGW